MVTKDQIYLKNNVLLAIIDNRKYQISILKLSTKNSILSSFNSEDKTEIVSKIQRLEVYLPQVYPDPEERNKKVAKTPTPPINNFHW